MFTQPCFIRRNTPELREKLMNLGHSLCLCTEFEGACWLSVNPNAPYTVHGVGYTSEEEFPGKTQKEFLDEFLQVSEKKEIVDCKINEDLFLALAALRDDSDKNQWFASNYWDKKGGPDEWRLCTEDDYKDFFGDCPYVRNYDDYHKATVEELIEHFKE